MSERQVGRGRPARTSPRALVGACALTLCATLLGTGPASAAPPSPAPAAGTPSQAEVDRARAAADAASGEVAAVEAELAAASLRLEESRVAAARAAEAYAAARVELGERTAEAQEASAAAAGAREDAAEARQGLARLAAGTYRTGGGLGEIGAFLSAGGPQDLIDRTAGLEAVAAQQTRVHDRLAASQQVAGLLEEHADLALAQQAGAERAAAEADRSAAAASGAATAMVATTESTREALIGQLAELRGTSTALERRRQDGLEAARAAEAERVARADRARRAEQARAPQTSPPQGSTPGRPVAPSGAPSVAPRPARPAPSAAPPSAAPPSAAPPSAAPPSTAPPSTPARVAAPAAAPAGRSSSSSSAGQSAVAWARTQIGKPYQWGGTGPDAFDCSGLTSQALRAAGVSVPRTSASQYAAAAKISYDELRPGDLVFYGDADDPASVWHVALYSGGGMMIEAPRAGVPVRETPLRMTSSMAWAGRP